MFTSFLIVLIGGCTQSQEPSPNKATESARKQGPTPSPEPSAEAIQSLVGKNFGTPDETKRPFEKGKIEIITVSGLKFSRETLEPGWKWSAHVKPVVGGESCQKSHVKIFLSGRQHIRMDDGTEMEFGPGDVAVMQPGHDAWVVGNEPNVLIELIEVVRKVK